MERGISDFARRGQLADKDEAKGGRQLAAMRGGATAARISALRAPAPPMKRSSSAGKMAVSGLAVLGGITLARSASFMGGQLARSVMSRTTLSKQAIRRRSDGQ